MINATAKTNYTPEMVEQAKADYLTGLSPEQIGEKIGRSARSVVAKLSREGVYKDKTHEAKRNGVTKADQVKRIAELVGSDEDVMGSLEKATGVALAKVLQALEANAAE